MRPPVRNSIAACSVILEVDASVIAQRVTMRSSDNASAEAQPFAEVCLRVLVASSQAGLPCCGRWQARVSVATEHRCRGEQDA